MPFEPAVVPAAQRLSVSDTVTPPVAQRTAVGAGWEPSGVQDEGTEVNTLGVKRWNFKGGGISVTQAGPEAVDVTVNAGAGGAVGPAGDVQISAGGGVFSSYTPGAGVTDFNVTPNSANLRAALLDETGGGVAVFNDSPTLAGTPVLSGPGTTTSNNAKGTESNVNPVNVQTTNNTVTTLDSVTLPSNCGVVCSWLVTAIRSDLTEVAAYSVTAAARNNAGTVTQGTGSPTTTVIAEDDATANATVDVSGTALRLRIQGPAAKTYQWTAIRTSLQVVP
jgi:hypothetical protein